MSSRRAAATTLADAAMMRSIGASARDARRCATVVTRALDMLDADNDLSPGRARDASSIILARCEICATCGIR